ncbi:unnamed protein product, partial [marine sediment metagenome]
PHGIGFFIGFDTNVATGDARDLFWEINCPARVGERD